MHISTRTSIYLIVFLWSVYFSSQTVLAQNRETLPDGVQQAPNVAELIAQEMRSVAEKDPEIALDRVRLLFEAAQDSSAAFQKSMWLLYHELSQNVSADPSSLQLLKSFVDAMTPEKAHQTWLLLNEIGTQLDETSHFLPAKQVHTWALGIAKSEHEQRTSTYNKGITLKNTGDYSDALAHFFEARSLAESSADSMALSGILFQIGLIYHNQNKLDEAFAYYEQSLLMSEAVGNFPILGNNLNNIGSIYMQRKEYDASLSYYKRALEIRMQLENKRLIGATYNNIGNMLRLSGQPDSAVVYFTKGIEYSLEANDKQGATYPLYGMAYIEQKRKNYAKAEQYVKRMLALSEEIQSKERLRTANRVLAEFYEDRGLYKQSLVHYKIFKTYSDSLFSDSEMAKTARLETQYHYEKQMLEEAKERAILDEQLQLRMFRNVALLVMLLVSLGFIISARKKNTQLAALNTELAQTNEILAEKNDEIVTQRDELIATKDTLEQTVHELKASQDQLIQQEKLASLGQLTAGIAHEIKNPLNFVNNFSELSIDLIEEALEEIAHIEQNEHAQETEDILADVKSNLAKIHSHGTRANSIVNSMLMHSRASGGEKKPTDFNAVVKEFVGLSFHGMRAGKHPINVDIQYDLDESVGEVSMIAEDFSRGILNLCNNGFDAMRERLVAVSRRQSAIGEQPSMYHPTLTVRTKKQGKAVVLEIEDNGLGIPEEIKDKILQPFFTTKKGTEGTGLGLSITNDIVKAHGGTIGIVSSSEGTRFIIELPS